MTIDQLIFVGFGHHAIALDRDTGEIVWVNSEMHTGYISMLLDGDRLIASSNGYMYCLNPMTGEVLWHNPLKGFGVGVAHLASVRGQSSQFQIEQAAEEEQTSHSATTAT